MLCFPIISIAIFLLFSIHDEVVLLDYLLALQDME